MGSDTWALRAAPIDPKVYQRGGEVWRTFVAIPLGTLFATLLKIFLVVVFALVLLTVILTVLGGLISGLIISFYQL